MVLTDKLNRAALLAVAGLLFLASLVPLLTREKASAYTLLGARQIKMSSSSAGNAANGSGAGVTYEVQFAMASNISNLEGIVVTFCENTPIIEDTTCDRPAGFSLDTASVSASATPGPINPAGWTAVFEDHASAAGADNTLTLTDATGLAVTTGNVVRFDIDGVTNPNAINTSFYARIYTYDADTEATGYTLANPNVVGASIDAGGVALSTAQQITVTAKVQERITFCVYTFPTVESAPGAADWDVDEPDPSADNNCGGKSGSAIVLGDVNGVLDSERGYVDGTSYFTVATNAGGDAIVRLKGNTLSNGVDTIDAIGDTPEASDDNTEQFGLCAYHYDTEGSATLFIANGDATPADDTTDYTGDNGSGADCSDIVQSARRVTNLPLEDADHNGALFALDTSQTNTTFGQVLAIKQAGPATTARMAYLGNISDTTEPGIYTTTLSFIATGTY